jgi:16S rRNA (guanine966-N2)-methyltransferase
MRIISGKYRGRKLKSPPSLQTRPTSDRLRETLFNILAPRIKGVRLLDLCAGSGAIGIEALSRGAMHATFVDRSRRMCGLVEGNLEALGVVEDESDVVCVEVAEFLRRRAKKAATPGDAFDIVFFDPPYATDYEAALERLGDQSQALLTDEAIVVVEHHKKKDLKEEFGSLHRYRSLKQGDSCLSFYSNAGSADVPSAQRA